MEDQHLTSDIPRTRDLETFVMLQRPFFCAVFKPTERHLPPSKDDNERL
jgi:hypothetical protein